MAELFQVTAPLLVREADGTQRVMAERFLHPEGLLYFELFWHVQRPAAAGIHLLRGAIEGEGPWRVGGAVIRVLGCLATDPGPADAWAAWQDYLAQGAPGYPDAAAIRALARAQGAILTD